jgi:hypothetical protein
MDKNAIKRKLETMQCASCGTTPVVTITGDSFKLTCCCSPFQEKVAEKLQQLIGEEIDKDMGNLFKM